MATTSEYESLCQQARRSFRRQDFARAIYLYKEALQIDEAHVDVHDGLATACFLTNDYDGAIEHFTRVTELDLRNGQAYINLGAVYNRVGNHAKAAEVLRKGIKFVPRSSEGFYNLGIACRKMNDANMAISAYREAVRINPQMGEAHLNLANVYFEQRNFQRAIIHYESALDINPDFERAKRGLRLAEEAITNTGKGAHASAPTHFGRSTTGQSVSKQRGGQTVAPDKMTREILAGARNLLTSIQQKLDPHLTRMVSDCEAADAESRFQAEDIAELRLKLQECVDKCITLRKHLEQKLIVVGSRE